MSYEKYSADELEVKEVTKGMGGREIQWYNTPITSKENILRLYEGKTPMWIPFTGEMTNVKADCDPENVARGMTGGIDGWGVEWEWVPSAGGAMVKPGNPKVEDIDKWEEVLTVPHPEEWDWQGCYDRTIGRKSDDKIFEMNSGVVSRGYRKEPYPQVPLLKEIQQKGGRIIISSDAHRAEHICYNYYENIRLAYDCGFRKISVLTKDGEMEIPI